MRGGCARPAGWTYLDVLVGLQGRKQSQVHFQESPGVAGKSRLQMAASPGKDQRRHDVRHHSQRACITRLDLVSLTMNGRCMINNDVIARSLIIYSFFAHWLSMKPKPTVCDTQCRLSSLPSKPRNCEYVCETKVTTQPRMVQNSKLRFQNATAFNSNLILLKVWPMAISKLSLNMNFSAFSYLEF